MRPWLRTYPWTPTQRDLWARERPASTIPCHYRAPVLTDDLARWAAAAKADEAGRARARERWLRRQAEEEATFAGVLVDLAERAEAVVVRTTGGRRHRGAVAAVGGDFVLLRADPGRWVLVAFDAIAAVRPADGAGAPAAGRRPPALDLLLLEALDGMAGDRSRVSVIPVGDPEPVVGELEAVGDDVLTIRLDGPSRARSYVRAAAIAEVAVDGG